MKFLKQKKRVYFLLLISFCCIYLFHNSVAADIVNTSYLPANGGDIENFAKQRDEYPWCIITCVKILLKDIKDKGIAGGQLVASINYNAIDKLNIGPQTPEGWNIEENFVKNLLLKKKTTGYDGYILRPNEFDVLNTAMNNSFRNKFCHFDPSCSGFFLFGRPESCPDKDLCTVLKTTDFNARFNIFKGFLSLLTEEELSILWDELTGDLKRIIVGKDSEVVFGELQSISSPENSVNSGVDYTVKSVTNYKQNLKEILNEIKQKRMVFMFFRNPHNHKESHACVAFAGNIINSNELELLPNEYVYIYNPWGCLVKIDNNTDPGRICNIDTRPNVNPMNWEFYEYVKFNY